MNQFGTQPDNPLAIGRDYSPPGVTLPLSPLRQATVQQLDAARGTAPVTVVAEVDMTGLKAVREQLKPVFQSIAGLSLTYTPFFARAVVRGLMAHPLLNAQFTPTGYLVPRYVNLAVLTDVPGGLLMPTLKNAEQKGIVELARDLSQLTQRARAGQLTPGETAGQTFVMTNPGRWGQTLFGTPIIKPPNVGIVSFEAIQKRPLALPNGQVSAHDMMYVALTADHRAVDGADMVGFLGKVKESLEDFKF